MPATGKKLKRKPEDAFLTIEPEDQFAFLSPQLAFTTSRFAIAPISKTDCP
jgi:hypothetical protein